MPHVLFITVFIGTWLYKPSHKKLKKSLLYVRENYGTVKENIQKNSEKSSPRLFTGNVYLFVTQNKSKGEEDFRAILARHIKPTIAATIRLDNRFKSRALLVAINNTKHLFTAGDIVAVVRGGGDTSDLQFDVYRDRETCIEIENLADRDGVITVSGIGHSTDHFPIEKSVNFAQITPTDAASQIVYLIDGGKW